MSEPPIAMSGVLGEVAEACGSGAALAMAAAFGGREVYIPRPEAIGETHPLAQALGLACARKVAAALVHGTVLVPLGPTSTFARRRDSYRRMKEEKRSNSYIARVLGVHLRTIERYGGGGSDTDQLGLFD